ncbi:diacylglycerol/lipid kinase family protein [Bordetella hinzii]|uniref:diacylglycerol/lipid kinase family protein n=1 Tax=Bordetella hinzii TaxID=103855 RepID=UPI00114F2FD1|nr:diacylglycerol kinase family protein [Bordetella hinzii]QDJ51424.1 diacylglycerol kinase [Bordetella hinzii]
MSLPPTALAGHEILHIIINTGSGRDDDGQTIIRDALQAAGRQHVIHPVHDARRLGGIARDVVARAREQGGVVVAAGGDGTLNAVAAAVLGSGVPFGILPQGTFNYFGRAYGISQDTAQAVKALLSARPRAVQVGLVNGRLFLVNASLGLYPQLLQDREAYKNRFGRRRWVALLSGLVTLWRHRSQLDLTLEYGGQRLRTPTLVVGNNALQLRQIGMAQADALDEGKLLAMTLRPVGTWALYGLLLRGLMSRLGEAEQVSSFAFKRLTVGLRRRRVKVAMDGEICWLDTPLRFEVSPEPLMLLVPAEKHRVEPA